MIRTYKYINKLLQLIIVWISLFSCSNKIIKTEPDLRQLYSLIKQYDPAKEFLYYKQHKPYNVGDSLNMYFKNVDPNIVILDTNFRKAILYLLEKKYLFIVKNTGDKNAFYVYNASNWGGEKGYTQFALNIFRKEPLDKGEDYNSYLNKQTDVICIDAIVKEAMLYNLGAEEHRNIHNACLKLMPSKCNDWG